MSSHFFEKIKDDSVILTPNRRLSTHLLLNYDNWQLKQGSQAWVTPSILPMQTWLQQLWQQLAHPNVLLTPYQELLIWQQIVAEHNKLDDFIDEQAAAKLAQQAWSYLQQWHKSIADIQEYANLEVETFSHWANNYLDYCQQHNAIDQWQMLEQIKANAQQLRLPKQLYLVGFDELVPLQQQLVNKLAIPTQHINATQQANTQCIALENSQHEINTMLRWAKQLYENNHQANIICVIPKLEILRPQIVKQVNQVFFPEKLINSEFTQQLINISGGYQLTQAPIIQAAIRIFQLNQYKIDTLVFSQLLLSQFLTDANSQLQQRALLDKAIRDLNEPTLTWHTLSNTIASWQKETGHDHTTVLDLIDKYLAFQENLPKKASHQQWAEQFIELLNLFDWPGERNLSSEEYQQVKRFYECVQEFQQSDLVENNISYAQAKKAFMQLLQNTLFQPETINGPIQILGLLEAAGLEADAIWIMGLDSTTWPAAAAPNPLIPAHKQREWQMPHSSAERELQFSAKIQQRFTQSCQQLILSYSQFDDDRELQPSTLLKSISEITINDLSLSRPAIDDYFTQQKTNHFDDQQGPAISDDEYISGGTGIFKSQAACPFQAFARYRLRSNEVAEPELHFNALERGLLLHAVLESVWKILGSHEKLIATNEQKLKTLIERSIDQALQQSIPYYSEKIKSRFKAIEKQRLQHLVFTWLEHEKTRPAFKVIAHEQWREQVFENVKLHIQIDRIDELNDGSQLLIDYKTGLVSTNSWQTDRLKEPQLPMYCLTDEKITSLSYVQLRAEKSSFKGLSKNDTEISGITAIGDEAWTNLVKHWHNCLTTLANEFNRGIASITPEPYACMQCELPSLCRIHEVMA